MGKRVRSKAEEEIAGLRSQRWTAGEASVVVSAWRASGLSMAAFSRRHRLTAQRIAWWRERLEKAAKRARGFKPGGGELHFVRAVLTDRTTGSPGAAVTIRVRSGMAVEITDPALVTPQWLSALIREVEEPAS